VKTIQFATSEKELWPPFAVSTAQRGLITIRRRTRQPAADGQCVTHVVGSSCLSFIYRWRQMPRPACPISVTHTLYSPRDNGASIVLASRLSRFGFPSASFVDVWCVEVMGACCLACAVPLFSSLSVLVSLRSTSTDVCKYPRTPLSRPRKSKGREVAFAW